MSIFIKKQILLRVAIGGAVITSFFFIYDMINVYILRPQRKQKIKSSIVIINGGIGTKIKRINKVSVLDIYYQFEINNKIYLQKNVFNLNFKSHGVNYLFERKLPVAYEIGNPENSFILIRPKDFEYFKVPFPDSLKWIKIDVLDDESN